MGAAIVRRVHEIGVARPDVALVLADDGLDGAVHGPQMHRHVRRVGNEQAGRIENRAGEVEPLLDVHRIGGVLQRHAHLLGDRHEQIVEHFEHHRIGVGADGAAPLELLHAAQHEMILGCELGLPAVLDHHRLMRLDDDGGPLHLVAGRQRFARIDHRLVPFAAGEEPGAARRRRQLAAFRFARLFVKFCSAADRFDRHRLDDHLFGAIDEAELRFVSALERGLSWRRVTASFPSLPASTISGVSVPA